MMWFVVWLWRFSWGFVFARVDPLHHECVYPWDGLTLQNRYYVHKHECSETYQKHHYSQSAKRTFLTQKNSTPVICFRYQKVSYHTYFFAIGLCYARPPKHMSSWHAISSLFGKNTKKQMKNMGLLFTGISSHIRLCTNNTKECTHTHAKQR